MKHVRCYREGYPRPQLVRTGWLDLNGEWDFAFDDAGEGERQGWQNGFAGGKIRVPFAVQTAASGIGDARPHNSVWYQKKFAYKPQAGRRVLLHFEGSDYVTKVWVNGSLAGAHTGAYTRFTFEIGSLLREGENLICVNVHDSYSLFQPRGKQRWKEESFTCHYTDTTGIWKSVWLEEVPLAYLSDVSYVTRGGSVECTVFTSGGAVGDEVTVEVAGEGRFSAPVDENGRAVIVIAPDSPRLWMPSAPQLYDAELRFGEDKAGSYFGIAEYSAQDGKLFCNHIPIYPKMLLLQGYWKDTGMTCPSERALSDDLERISAMGANGVRMHQKTENELFYYYADLLGVLVWSEMPSSFRYSRASVPVIVHEYAQLVGQFSSHPCIQTLVAFNESWGVEDVMKEAEQRRFVNALYCLSKTLRPDKLCIGNDGWESCMTDIVTFHEYAQDEFALEAVCRRRMEALEKGVPSGEKRETVTDARYYTGQPVMVSEYGGVTYRPDGGSWGYGNSASDAQEFYTRLKKLTQAVRRTGCAGYCLTQATDCEQEQNGLMDRDHKLKLQLSDLQDIFAL